MYVHVPELRKECTKQRLFIKTDDTCKQTTTRVGCFRPECLRATTEKESQNNRKYVHNKSEPVVPVDVARIAPSQRQIHPLFDEKAQLLAYDEKKNPTPAALRRSPEDTSTNPLVSMPKKPPVNSSATLFVQSSVRKSTSSGYHPAPNICVEGGRIEFIKSPSEGSNLASLNPPVTLPPRPGFDKGSARKGISSQYADVSQCKKDVVAATRAQHTQADLADFDFNEEKCDVAKFDTDEDGWMNNEGSRLHMAPLMEFGQLQRDELDLDLILSK
ncbi:hypothetical protein RUM44_008457 [Polyplax serrata]|uniref:Uncharacterized protein n=1 Tax=Polyplax serrata TaxID=468196 RepID=A0ABR1B8A7_POLSC